MKRKLFILIFFSTFMLLKAQFAEKNAIYISGSVSAGNYVEGNLSLNYVANQKYAIQFAYASLSTKSSNIPKSRVSIFGDHDEMKGYQLLFGPVIKFKPLGTSRLIMAVGLGFNSLEFHTNWRKEQVLFITYWVSDIEKIRTTTFILKPEFEFPFSKVLGLKLSPVLQFGKNKVFAGIGVGLMLGILRE